MKYNEWKIAYQKYISRKYKNKTIWEVIMFITLNIKRKKKKN